MDIRIRQSNGGSYFKGEAQVVYILDRVEITWIETSPEELTLTTKGHHRITKEPGSITIHLEEE